MHLKCNSYVINKQEIVCHIFKEANELLNAHIITNVSFCNRVKCNICMPHRNFYLIVETSNSKRKRNKCFLHKDSVSYS